MAQRKRPPAQPGGAPRAATKTKTTPPMKFRSSVMQMPSLRTLGLKQPPVQSARKLGLPTMPTMPTAPTLPTVPTVPTVPGVGGGRAKKSRRRS